MSTQDTQGGKARFLEILESLGKTASKTGAAVAGGVPSGPKTGSPGTIGSIQQSPTPPTVGPGGGGQQPRIPQIASAQASQGPRQLPQVGGGQTEFKTKGGRDAAIVSGAINNITEAIHGYKVEKFQKASAQAEQVWGNYLALQSAIEGEQDPQKKQQLQKLADEMLKDPKVNKVLDKAHSDPMSAEGVGIQRAMQQSMTQAQDKAKLELIQAQRQAEQQRAMKEQAQAGLYEKQAAQEGTVTAKDRFEAASKLEIAKANIASKGYQVKVHGLHPAIEDPNGRWWTWEDASDPNRLKIMPDEAKRGLVAERESKMAEITESERKQQIGFNNSMARLTQTFENAQQMPAIKLYHDAAANAMWDDMRYLRMQHNMEKGIRGDQQAQLSLISDHVSMTLRQPGKNVQRPTLAQWKEAEASRDFVEGLSAMVEVSDDGSIHLKKGVVLTEAQMKQMVDLGHTQHELDWMTAHQAYRNSGLDPKKVKMAETIPGLEIVDPNFKMDMGGSKGGGEAPPPGAKIIDMSK